jgi:hypothetical protein
MKTASLTLLEFFEQVYLPEQLQDAKPSYRQRFCRIVERFVAYHRGDVRLADITPDVFKRYKDWYLDCNRGGAGDGLWRYR